MLLLSVLEGELMEESTQFGRCKHFLDSLSQIHCVWGSWYAVRATLSLEPVLVGRLNQSYGSDSFVDLWDMGPIPLHLKHHFQWEILFISPKKVFGWPRYNHFTRSGGSSCEAHTDTFLYVYLLGLEMLWEAYTIVINIITFPYIRNKHL